ncbi:MAG TPA: helicase-related protein, partial [Mizugakiibacter sp.]
PFEAMIVFARTKQATDELAEKLQARGFAAAAINGDVAQPQRERIIQQLREGKLDILVATDVAARGLDVERISHVLNYDIPYDTESYVHRIGRTGRAGRSGEAILFVTPREKGMLRAIERATRQPIAEMTLPSVEAVNDRRIARFMQRIGDTLAAGGLEPFQALIDQYEAAHDVPAREIAAALARLAHGEAPLLLEVPPKREPRDDRRHEATMSAKPPRAERGPRPPRERARAPEPGFETYRIEVGHAHRVKPGNIVGAIANEAGLDSQYIGRVRIEDEHSFVDLPEGMPGELLQHLKKVRVAGRMLRIARVEDAATDAGASRPARHPVRSRPGGKVPPKRKPARR